MRALSFLLTCVLAANLPAVAATSDEPALRHGMWKLKKLINKRPYESRQCMHPYHELLRRQQALKESGCQHDVARSGETQWRITSRCRKVNSEGRHWESDTLTVMTVTSDSAYRLEVTGTTNTVPSQETVDAVWTGHCTEPAQ